MSPKPVDNMVTVVRLEVSGLLDKAFNSDDRRLQKSTTE